MLQQVTTGSYRSLATKLTCFISICIFEIVGATIEQLGNLNMRENYNSLSVYHIFNTFFSSIYFVEISVLALVWLHTRASVYT